MGISFNNIKLTGQVIGKAFTSIVTDTLWPYVSLLLNGDGAANGANNNTFVDSSPNNYAITASGSPAQGSFSPYGNLWSNYFNGTNATQDAIICPVTNLTTGNFTVEVWGNFQSTGNDQQIIDLGASGFSLYLTGSGIRVFNRVLGADLFGATAPITFGQWTHIAFVLTTGTTNGANLYINGVKQLTATSNTSFSSTTVTVGSRYAYYSSAPAGWFGVLGYLSNARITNTIVYTSNFTPSTSPLTAVTGTALLTCQSNRFIDNSSNAYALTINGAPSVQRFSPFSPTSAYSKSLISGSGYFNGSSDLSIPSFPVIGNNSFTAETWFYMTTVPASGSAGTIFSMNANSGTYGAFRVEITPTSQIQLLMSTDGANWQINSGAISNVMLNEWMHVAITRNATSGAVDMYLNGQSIFTGSIGSLYGVPSIKSGQARMQPIVYISHYRDIFRMRE